MSVRKRELPAILFFVFAEFMYSFDLTYITLPKLLYSFILDCVFITFFLAFISNKWNVEEIIKVIIILIISLLVYAYSKESLYLTLIFSAIVMKNISYKNAAKTIFIVRLLMTLSIVLLGLVGFLPLNKMIISKGIFGYAVGYGLGYQHPNNLAQALFLLCCLYLCIEKEKLNSFKIYSIVFIDLFIYAITKSKTTCIILLIVCVCLLIRNKKIFLKVVKSTALWYVFSITVVSIIIPMMYANLPNYLHNFIYSINGILNGRFSNASMLFITYPITLFGKIVDTQKLEYLFGYNVIDNGYTFLFFNYGVIGFALLIFLYVYALKSFIKQKEYVYLIILLGFLSLAIMENVIRAMFMNFTVIFLYEFVATSSFERKEINKTYRNVKNEKIRVSN